MLGLDVEKCEFVYRGLEAQRKIVVLMSTICPFAFLQGSSVMELISTIFLLLLENFYLYEILESSWLLSIHIYEWICRIFIE